MARRKILRYPDPRLHTIARPVEVIDDALRSLITDMAETMYASQGIGLAATQINVHRRVIVIDTSDTGKNLLVLINPEIIRAGGSASHEEGCLSVPGVTVRVRRAEWIQVQSIDEDGALQEFRADGLEAMCIQHEMDHLQGIVFTDHLPAAQQSRLRKDMSESGNRRR
ncbi:MAG: peptide deformylase [Oxalicibacterium faecigallinarum]|uniref:peptide deformylase n=1 Tax=Oxalicibacterium faecigallinarum TaxID=573741 RepID=UPI002806D28D|nr:peptide deformylase [Oxalicibacterium faecigallinarum]MDQ7970905.1 peptide deformylase [Oxalicibacterium faecigallinarum]